MSDTLYYEVGLLDEDIIYLNSLQEDPIVRRWLGMLRRCYSGISLKDNPSYLNVYVCEDWLRFSNFKSWMLGKDWKDNHLDKDLLGDGTLYQPTFCCFIPPKVNMFMVESKTKRGDCPLGVSYRKDRDYYEAYCNDPSTTKKVRLGVFDDPYHAAVAYQKQKLIFAKGLAVEIKDPRISNCFVSKYELKLQVAEDNLSKFLATRE